MSHSTPTMLGGYRLVRLLGAGARADVYLGSSAGGSAVLKVYRPSVERDDIGRELDALGRGRLDHCVRLLDVATADTGLPAAILARVQRGSVAQLLRERESIELGEAVTLLAPLVTTMTALHSHGVAHTRIGAASVHLGAAGEPVLLGFGHAHLFEPRPSVAVLDAEPAAEADRDGIAALTAFALSHVRGAEPRMDELLTWLEATAGRRRVESGQNSKTGSLISPTPGRSSSGERRWPHPSSRRGSGWRRLPRS